ncbi:hypothetical protein SAMN05216584_11074 [Selenomonas sp. WCT3]|uniref:hypothetical protein n=1 Tax=Selenomonas sp. WCT3 TaxID=3158785 RepID=UPI0008843483|nr:hypothetical protein SAMN05216584_11074 [Selenomonas ruminantium]
MKQKWFSAGVLLALVFSLLTVWTMPAGAQAKLLDEDFICNTVALGDDDAKVIEAFGNPIYDRTVRIAGILVKECDFNGDFTIGFAVNTGKVVDITIKNKKYEARNGVRYGATAAWIQQTYGAKKARRIDGNKFFVYDNPKDRFQHLMLQMNTEDNSLLVMRITALPVDDTERQELMIRKPELFREKEQKSVWFIPSEKEIDMSAMPEDKPIRLGGLTE